VLFVSGKTDVIEMRFALIDGQREEAQPGLSGNCPTCGNPMVAKCGEVRMRHWAHQGSRRCDPWWEPETEWHRAWKGQFPDSWQEVIHQAQTGEKHIADVKTDRGWVIEFQHSYLNPEERRSREAFYPKLIWVVDGTRRKRDRPQLVKALKDSLWVGENLPVRQVDLLDCTLLREWAGSNALTFFDLGNERLLYWLLPKSASGSALVSTYPRAAFMESHRGAATEFEDFVNDISKRVADHESQRRAEVLKRDQMQAHLAFQQLTVAWDRRRRRF
jgi:competence protein CoiA